MKNHNKNLIIGVVILLIIVGAWLIFSNRLNKSSLSNSVLLKNNNKTVIIIENEVEYFPGAKGYFVRPEAQGNYPGVIMIHENRGLRPEIREMAETLAKEGYMVLAVDLLGGIAEDQQGAQALTAKFNQEIGVVNMKAAADYLRQKGANRLASLGWCFGGKQSVELSISGEKLDATVVYYGGGLATTTERLKPINWPVLGIFGDQDRVISAETVKAFQDSLNSLNIKNQIYIYPGVGHAFANPSGMNYAEKETKDAWDKTLQFLNDNLKL